MDVLLVSLGQTGGWRTADAELAASLRRAGATVEVATVPRQRDVRTFALTDLVQARAARAVAQRAIAQHAPRAVIYGGMTAALLWPRPGAIRYDALPDANRPGRHGIWQRPLARRRLREAPLLLPWSDVPPPVEPSGPAEPKDLAAVAYAADPDKRRPDVLVRAWQAARREGEELVIAGLERPDVEGVRFAGTVPNEAFRALLRRARVYLCAPRFEDHGIAPLEALADGCVVVTTPAPGPYPARDLVRGLDPRFVTDDLPAAVRVALDDPPADWALRALAALAPFRRDAVDRKVAEVLPTLLAS